jgi:hypothetical protein
MDRKEDGSNLITDTLVVSKHLVMTGCDRLNVCIQRVQARFAHAETNV